MTCTTPPDWSPTTDGRTTGLGWEPDLSWPAPPESWDFRPEQIGLYGGHAEAAESVPVPPVSPALAGLAQSPLSSSAASGARTAAMARAIQSPRRSLRAPQPVPQPVPQTGVIAQAEPPRLWYTKKRYALSFLLLLVVLVIFGVSRVGGAGSGSAAGSASVSSAGDASPSVATVGRAVRPATS